MIFDSVRHSDLLSPLQSLILSRQYIRFLFSYVPWRDFKLASHFVLSASWQVLLYHLSAALARRRDSASNHGVSLHCFCLPVILGQCLFGCHVISLLYTRARSSGEKRPSSKERGKRSKRKGEERNRKKEKKKARKRTGNKKVEESTVPHLFNPTMTSVHCTLAETFRSANHPKCLKVLYSTSWETMHSYGTSPASRDHAVLVATQHR